MDSKIRCAVHNGEMVATAELENIASVTIDTNFKFAININSHTMSRAIRHKGRKDTKRVPIRIETGKFEFLNGDTYEGEFVIDSKSNIIFRQGAGSYRTHEGQIYEGKWVNDKLVINAKITFPTKCIFEGQLSDVPTYTNGTYTFSDKSELVGDFKKLFNGVRDAAIFKDPNGKIWDITYRDNRLELMFPWNWNKAEVNMDEDSCDEK